MLNVIYIAGPFRSRNANGSSNAWGVQQNIMTAMALSLEVWQRGHVGLCPHSNTCFFQDANGVDDRVWLEGDIELLRRSDAILVTANWQTSTGARQEVEYAELHGIPVLYSLFDLDLFLARQATTRQERETKHGHDFDASSD